MFKGYNIVVEHLQSERLAKKNNGILFIDFPRGDEKLFLIV